jgi:hypothetical protein
MAPSAGRAFGAKRITRPYVCYEKVVFLQAKSTERRFSKAPYVPIRGGLAPERTRRMSQAERATCEALVAAVHDLWPRGVVTADGFTTGRQRYRSSGMAHLRLLTDLLTYRPV